MATYEELHGKRVEVFDSEPTLNSSYEGQVWYNEATGTLKSLVLTKAWASSSILNTARIQLSGAVSSPNTASLAFGGDTPPGVTGATEEYNGSGWSNGGSLSTARRLGAGAGTQTAALYFGGNPPGSGATTTEEYGGASWTSGGALPVAKGGLAGCGLQTAALAFGGSPPTRNTTEEYDGSSWTAGGTLSVAFEDAAGAGTQTAGLKFGGRGTPTQTTEKYNGSSWTTSGLMNTGRGYLGGAGIQTAALGYGGMTLPNTYQTATEEYDGTTWTTIPATMGTGIRQFGGTGATASAALAFGGESAGTATLGTTEEYNSSINAFTAAAWASAPSIGTGRYLGGYGITPTNASIIFGGQSTTSESKTEEYNGTSWAENPDMNTARSRINGFGTQTAAVTMGGRQVGVPPNVNMNNTELYDGSSWTNGPSYPLTVRGIGGAGTNAAGLAIAAWTGSPPGFTTCNDWNGSGWTAAEANLNTARGYVSGWGTQSDAGAAGGPPANTDYEEYNGSSWTTKTSLITATGGPSGGAAGFGGTPGAIKANGNGGTFSQQWNGTSWGTAPSRANTNYGGGMSGGNTAASGIVTGGYIYPSTGPATGSEEFTGETSAVAPASNITTS